MFVFALILKKLFTENTFIVFQVRLSQANSQNIFEQTKIGVTLTFGHFIPNANAIFCSCRRITAASIEIFLYHCFILT